MPTGKIELVEDELVDGVIPHGGRNDECGSYLCPSCLVEQRTRWLTFWAMWHQANGYTEAQFKAWASANDYFPGRYGWIGD